MKKDPTLYYKRGKRYIPAGFGEWPMQPGLWIVTANDFGTSRMFLGRVSDLPNAVPLAKLKQHHELVCKVILRETKGVPDPNRPGWNKIKSASEIADAVILALAGRKE